MVTLRSVAVFDADLPCAVAFLRSLGRAGVPRVLYGHRANPAGRCSRFATDFRSCPPVSATDEFVDWLAAAMSSGEIDLVAPTSDALVFCLAEAHERLGRKERGHPLPDALRDCLFKDWFADRMQSAGFPVAPWAAPVDRDEALAAAERIGYPVVLKPRSHVAVGLARGTVAHDPGELVEQFVPYPIGPGQRSAQRHHGELAWPILQRYYAQHDIDIVSVSGCLDDDGNVVALAHSRKLRASPPNLGTGTRFEAIGPQPFTERAITAVREVLGRGLFELEVLVHHPSQTMWTIDLNPRGYGQIALEIARGDDLPLHWYEAVTGEQRRATNGAHRRPPAYWESGVHFYTGALVGLVVGPRRLSRLAEFARSVVQPRVGSFLDWRDPRPAVSNLRRSLRHPRALVTPYLQNRHEPERDQ